MSRPAGPSSTLPKDANDQPCTGCAFKVGEACRRFPPVFAAGGPVPPTVAQPNGGFTVGQWSFPPAARRCGEFA